MSEFECRYGHLMRSRDRECAACAEEGRFGEGICYMDGLTGSQHRQREAYYEQLEREEHEDED
jgi:hypothetical protein